ncbi:uncharacterized protein PHACADRAFT_183454 [Phanerochaete carnosa HHB-10118-sp]|uniref:Uncharacterized protein n=1 Tax=Phanerochaete carnosa (strain HHB-10118-sp) TaxID=650164 RepID=K5V2V9_PHACS|nr:uncharacterized protein PHACADRAFT_183454 [Phanerochaete carnosa HHB-10118-sp]EKM56881.1 hypothetical protein PHACADRAFT_183454 [Phanerochaete carnosa HHB-10118-sp]
MRRAQTCSIHKSVSITRTNLWVQTACQLGFRHPWAFHRQFATCNQCPPLHAVKTELGRLALGSSKTVTRWDADDFACDMRASEHEQDSVISDPHTGLCRARVDELMLVHVPVNALEAHLYAQIIPWCYRWPSSSRNKPSGRRGVQCAHGLKVVTSLVENRGER